MHTLKVTQIGNSLGLVLPKEVLAKLGVGKGEALYLTDSPDGLRITSHNPDFEEQMRVAREVMKDRRAVLRELAR